MFPSWFFLSFWLISFFKVGWSWGFLFQSDLSLVLVLVVCFTFFLTVFISKSMKMFIFLTCLGSLMFFLVDSQVLFYIFFEASIFPVIIMLLFFGNTFERFEAASFMIFFSSMSAYPAAVSILMESWGSISMNFFISTFWASVFLFAFLVKLPLYFFHYWLPKAHVEAPTVGSMILAGLLLKLGGWGITRLLPLFVMSWYFSLVFIFLCVGICLAPLWALCHSDSKGLVAFSSISHMNFCCLVLFLGGTFSKTSSVLSFLTHDIISCIMFWMVGMLYHISYSRQILFLSSLGQFSLLMLGVAMFFYLSNFGLPPFLSFFHELLFLNLVFGHFLSGWLFICGYLLLVLYFTLFLFLNMTVYKNSSSKVSSLFEELILMSCLMLCLVPFFSRFCV